MPANAAPVAFQVRIRAVAHGAFTADLYLAKSNLNAQQNGQVAWKAELRFGAD